MNKRMNKKGAEIQILLLVLLAFILSISALVSFNSYDKNLQSDFESLQIIERTHSEEVLLKYYIENIFNNAVENMNCGGEDVKTIFVKYFYSELGQYQEESLFYVQGLWNLEGFEDNIEIIGGNQIQLTVNLNFVANRGSVSFKFEDKFILKRFLNKNCVLKE